MEYGRTRIYLTGMILGGVLSFVMVGPVMAVSPKTPTESVKSTITDLVRVLVDQEMYQPTRSSDRLREIERALRSHVSFEEMARRSLGRPWSDLTEMEQHAFSDLFIQFLARSVSGWRFDNPLYARFHEYSDQFVIYQSERSEGKFSEVRTRLRSLKADTQLDFRLVNQSGDWRVYDVVADYVSVSDNYRAQFANILRLFTFGELEGALNENPLLPLLEKALNRR